MLRIFALGCILVFAASQNNHARDNDDIWAAYKHTFQKTYRASEDRIRRDIFENTLVKIQRHNLEADMGLHSYWQGLTQFTDWSHEEFRNKMLGYEHITKPSTAPIHDVSDMERVKLPKHVDWRTKGYVTPVKYQNGCGDAWAFSATGSLEGQHFAQTGKLVSLSEQNLLDCSSDYGNMGCMGGRVDWSFEYIIHNQGIDTEECYPYQYYFLPCRYKMSCKGATMFGYKDVKQGSEDALQDAIANVGPISVVIDASLDSFFHYRSGVYDETACSSTNLNHAVLAVGYGVDNGKDYYIVKNCWSHHWGMDGYIWMSRNKNNQCGIATNASYPLV